MANTDNPNGFSLVKTGHGQMAPLNMPVAASQTIAKGDAVILVSGLITIAVVTSPQIYGVANAAIITGASPSRITDRIPIYPATPDNIFEGQASGSSVATLVGTDVDIEGATGVMEVNENATTEQVFRVIELVSDFDPTRAIGLNDRLRGYFIRSSYLGHVADV